ncbi:MAG: hypothetical protein K1V76_01485, partial [Candidatus Amulumruptor sp.]
SKASVRMVAVINAGVVVLAGVAVWVAQGLWSSQLEMMQASPSSLFPTVLVMLGIMLVLTLLSIVVIRRRVRGTFRLS